MIKILKGLFLLSIALCLTHKSIVAQQISLSNQYIVNKFSLNPAYVGACENLGVYGSYRKDWVGVSEAPETKMISADGAVFKNMGLGCNITSLQAGIFNNFSAMVTYAYHIKFTSSKYFSIGLGFGILENHLNLYNNENAQNDPVINNINRTSSLFEANFGFLYHGKKLHFGFVEVPRLSGNKNNSYFLWPQQKAHISYKINFSKTWAIDPIVVFYPPTKMTPAFGEINVPIIYQQKVWLCLFYKESSTGLGIGANLKSNIVFNYTFEWYEHGLAHRSGGTHEITLGWKVSKKKTDQIKRNKKKPYYNWINK